jgi:hypothetical protein
MRAEAISALKWPCSKDNECKGFLPGHLGNNFWDRREQLLEHLQNKVSGRVASHKQAFHYPHPIEIPYEESGEFATSSPRFWR